MPHTVICTAGHIDHGKSSLVQSLTGFNPDTLKEEQEREMTIELGFAFYRDDVTFIDVPGHEKFLKTMMAGASGVDGAILVVAADDSVMPQTREHFEILKLMGIRRGIIALTKVDIADPDWVELVKEDIRELVTDSFLEGAPILPVSNRTGAGFDKLRAALDEVISSKLPRKDRGLFRMWVDRSFTMHGSGTIVAGTVLSGTVNTGDRIEILPQGLIARVKRIQVHKVDVEQAKIGERAALNLPGIDKESVKRGDLLASPDHYRPTYMLNVRLNTVPILERALQNRDRLRLHLGSSEHIGRVTLLEKQPIYPGMSGLVQIRLEDIALADIGDHFVVRSFSEGRVVGGGVVLETRPAKVKYATEEEIIRLNRLESAEPYEIIRQFIARLAEKTADADLISRDCAFRMEEVVDIIHALRRDGEVVLLQKEPKWTVAPAARFDELKAAMLSHVEDFHKSNPQLKGIRRSDIKAQLMPDASNLFFDKLIEKLDRKIESEGELVWQKGHKIGFTSVQEGLKVKIEELFRIRKFQPPEPDDVAAELQLKLKDVDVIITGLCELGILVKLYTPEAKPMYYHQEALADAKKVLMEFFNSNQELKFTDYRQLIESTRKYTTPILNYFDDIGLTYRDGELRKLRIINPVI